MVARAQRGFRKELSGLGPVLLIPMGRIEQRIEKFIGRPGLASLVVQRLSQRGVVHLGGDGDPTREVMAKELAEDAIAMSASIWRGLRAERNSPGIAGERQVLTAH